MNGLLLFQKGSDIWSSDGTVSGTAVLASGAEFLAASGGKLYFRSSTHLWATDGTIPGTVELTDFSVSLHQCVSGACYFSDNTSGLHGLWKTDGTPGGTLELAPLDLNGTTLEFVDVGGTVFFPVSSVLWKTNGTPGGTVPVADVAFPRRLVSAYGQLFFNSQDQLWRSNGTTAGTELVKSFGTGQVLAVITVVDGRLLLKVDEPACMISFPCPRGWHLYRSDGTPTGTQLVADLAQTHFPCPSPLCVGLTLAPRNSMVIGEEWFFAALDTASLSPALWVATHVFFSDVAPDHWAFSWVERLAEAGITVGCNPELYCPDQSVTRAQMAIFIERAKHGPGFTRPPGTGTVFADVPASYWALDWIEQLLRRRRDERLRDGPAGLLPGGRGHPRGDGGLPAESQARGLVHAAPGGWGHGVLGCPGGALGGGVDRPARGGGDHERVRRRRILPGRAGDARGDGRVPGEGVRACRSGGGASSGGGSARHERSRTEPASEGLVSEAATGRDRDRGRLGSPSGAAGAGPGQDGGGRREARRTATLRITLEDRAERSIFR